MKYVYGSTPPFVPDAEWEEGQRASMSGQLATGGSLLGMIQKIVAGIQGAQDLSVLNPPPGQTNLAIDPNIIRQITGQRTDGPKGLSQEGIGMEAERDRLMQDAAAIAAPKRRSLLDKRDILPILGVIAALKLMGVKDRDIAKGAQGFLGGRQMQNDTRLQNDEADATTKRNQVMAKIALINERIAKGQSIAKQDWDANQAALDRQSKEKIAGFGIDKAKIAAEAQQARGITAQQTEIIKALNTYRGNPQARTFYGDMLRKSDPERFGWMTDKQITGFAASTAGEDLDAATGNLRNEQATDIKETRAARIDNLVKGGKWKEAQAELAKAHAELSGIKADWYPAEAQARITQMGANAELAMQRANQAFYEVAHMSQYGSKPLKPEFVAKRRQELEDALAIQQSAKESMDIELARANDRIKALGDIEGNVSDPARKQELEKQIDAAMSVRAGHVGMIAKLEAQLKQLDTVPKAVEAHAKLGSGGSVPVPIDTSGVPTQTPAEAKLLKQRNAAFKAVGNDPAKRKLIEDRYQAELRKLGKIP